jgi:peptidoglycan hydrolase-like protein with peptidoglycan-binding domain
MNSAYGYVAPSLLDRRYYCIQMGATDSTSNNSVSSLINRLIEAGYTPRGKTHIGDYVPFLNSVDAVFDEAVFEAVKAFQRDKKLPVTGRVDAPTWKALGVASLLIQSCPDNVGGTTPGGAPAQQPPPTAIPIPVGPLYNRVKQDLVLLHGVYPTPGVASSGSRAVRDSNGYLILQLTDNRLFVAAAGKGDAELDALLGIKPEGKGGKLPFPWWTIPAGVAVLGAGYWAWRKWR